MTTRALRIYLNDHLAGANLGADLARLIESRSPDAKLGELMRTIAPQIEEDRQTLLEVMARVGIVQDATKRVSGWVAAKISQAKFRGVTSGSPESATLAALESLELGVRGKLGLWQALQAVASSHPQLAEFNLESLADRARSQYESLERARVELARQALS